MPTECPKSPIGTHKFRYGKCIWCGKEEKVPKRPTLKELFRGEVLDGFVEAARVRPLNEFKEKHNPGFNAEFIVRVYSPYDLSETTIVLSAVDAETAKTKAVGRTAFDASGYEFEVEEHNIISVYPFRTAEPLPYKTYPLDPTMRPPSWLLGATLVESRPLPIGARPVGSPELTETIKDALTTLIYQQKIRSPQYPEQQFHIQYTRYIFTKFVAEAQRIRQAGKIPEAVLYLINHSPGITIRMISEMLDIGYWTAYREVAKLVSPVITKKLTPEIEEQATIERWTPEQLTETKAEIEREATRAKTPKAAFGPLWRKQLTIYPIKPKTEEELLAELSRIFTLEKYFPTETEWKHMQEAAKKQTDALLRQSIEYYLQAKK